MDCQLLNLWRGASSPDFLHLQIWDDFPAVDQFSSAPHLLFHLKHISIRYDWAGGELSGTRSAILAPQYAGKSPLVELSQRCPTGDHWKSKPLGLADSATSRTSLSGRGFSLRLGGLLVWTSMRKNSTSASDVGSRGVAGLEEHIKWASAMVM